MARRGKEKEDRKGKGGEKEEDVQGLSERIFLLRDQLVPPKEVNDSNVPGWDISINYVPVTYAERYKPAIIEMQPEEVQVAILPICCIYICKDLPSCLAFLVRL